MNYENLYNYEEVHKEVFGAPDYNPNADTLLMTTPTEQQLRKVEIDQLVSRLKKQHADLAMQLPGLKQMEAAAVRRAMATVKVRINELQKIN